ncbi:MAG: Pyridoxamine 5'-phosphate oxidase [Firmicutes bacterium ADurb.Bin153]|nr:MAG: Pyridoxamine 5'-phosphate oxidase [Firmicutes bacterium ADurb.Bin153]
MRRKDRQIEDASEIVRILERCETGFLATCGTEMRPMATPVNYVYGNGSIFFHCALQGRKLDNISSNPNVGFTVATDIDIDRETMTTHYSSVMVEGIASVVDSPTKKKEIICLLIGKLAAEGAGCTEETAARTNIVEIKITSLVGKKNKR